jgi:hypothetical protein
MATTTNYGWDTPDDTDLVKDGAAAIRTLGSSIDTTTFANAAAALSATIVDAKGDLIAATAADAVSRLAVGANDTVLTADSAAATGMKWAAGAASGMTLVQRSTFSTVANTGTTFDGVFTSTYNNYLMVMDNFFGTVGSAFVGFNWRVSAATQSAASYRYAGKGAVTGSGGWNDMWSATAQTSGIVLNMDNGGNGASASYTVQMVGSGSNQPRLSGSWYSVNNGYGGFAWLSYQTPIVASGFILTPSSGTISGTVSIYGLAI